jgi:hypothetical protein
MDLIKGMVIEKIPNQRNHGIFLRRAYKQSTVLLSPKSYRDFTKPIFGEPRSSGERRNG